MGTHWRTTAWSAVPWKLPVDRLCHQGNKFDTWLLQPCKMTPKMTSKKIQMIRKRSPRPLKVLHILYKKIDAQPSKTNKQKQDVLHGLLSKWGGGLSWCTGAKSELFPVILGWIWGHLWHPLDGQFRGLETSKVRLCQPL